MPLKTAPAGLCPECRRQWGVCLLHLNRNSPAAGCWVLRRSLHAVSCWPRPCRGGKLPLDMHLRPTNAELLPLATQSSCNTMGLPGQNIVMGVWPMLLLLLGAWLVELCGLYFLHTSCRHNHVNPAWAAAAAYPVSGDCLKLFRFHWWTIVFEFPLVGGIILCILRGIDAVRRYRLAFLGCFAVSAVLHMLAANASLNLVDTGATKFETSTENLRAKVTTIGFAAGAAFSILMLFVLGDDGHPLPGMHADTGATDDEPLLGRDRPGVV